MRLVEPEHFEHQPKSGHKKKMLAVLFVVLLLLSVTLFVLTRQKPAAEVPEASSQPQQEQTEQEVLVDDGIDTLRIFTDNEFKVFYDNLLQPNLERVTNPPSISGDVVADARIRKIAENRGYRLRNSPSVALSSVDGYPVQEAVVGPWRKLKAAAAAEGLQISIVSAYRSVDTQRGLFLSRLSAAGATITQVAAGTADDRVNEVLITSSIPGYSKHHTGYTIDIQCAGYAFEGFKDSPCNSWISADNYKVAKENGFIPSYPPLADAQGPDPEAWEYVWVGTDLLYE